MEKKGHFVGELDWRVVGPLDRIMRSTLEFIDSEGNSHYAHEGERVNLCSTPRILWRIFPPFGKYNKACAIHDCEYQRQVPKAEADFTLQEMAEVLGCRPWRIRWMYRGVKWFGKGKYKEAGEKRKRGNSGVQG